jgi:hypothetical protein
MRKFKCRKRAPVSSVVCKKYLLAFAGHDAEFYSGSGKNARRAFELASISLANRPTLRAFRQAHESAVSAEESYAASELLIAARECWGGTTAFGLSPLAAIDAVTQKSNGAAR